MSSKGRDQIGTINNSTTEETTMAETETVTTALVGCWQLVRFDARTPDGAVVHLPLGDAPHGVLIYTRDRRMSVVISAANRPEIRSDDMFGGTEAERAAAFASCLAYAGRYEILGDRVVHSLEVSSLPNWLGLEQVRFVEMKEDTLVLRTPPTLAGGQPTIGELEWRRAG